MRRALGDTFACTELNVTVYDWAVLPAVESLRVGALALTLPAAEHEAPPGVLTVLTGMPGLTSLATALNVPGDLAPLKSVKTLFADMRFGEGFDLKAWAKTLPNVTELELLYEDKEGAWEPEAVSAFTGVKSVTMGNWNEAGELGSQSVSIEAGEMLVSTAHALPSNVIFNGIRASKVTLDTLGLKDAKTRERIAFEKKATENTTLLTDWWRDTVGSDWGEAAVPSPLVGPIVIVKGTESSAKDGAWGEDHNGVPAVVLCAEVDGCAYVVEFGHRAGAASGRYAPASGGAVVFEGNLGETTVTIYDPEAKSKAVVVVATTRPPDTVHSKSEAIGPADYDAAWRWVKNNVVKNSAASGDSA
jgi:hypothetical protein